MLCVWWRLGKDHIIYIIKFESIIFRFVSFHFHQSKHIEPKKMLLSAIIITSYHVIHWLLDVRNLFKFKKNDDDQLSINQQQQQQKKHQKMIRIFFLLLSNMLPSVHRNRNEIKFCFFLIFLIFGIFNNSWSIYK